MTTQETKCNGVHCRCMDIGGFCPNMHWYHCKEHNPDAYPKGGMRPSKDTEALNYSPTIGAGSKISSPLTHDREKLIREILLPAELVKDLEDQIVNQILDLLSTHNARVVKKVKEKSYLLHPEGVEVVPTDEVIKILQE